MLTLYGIPNCDTVKKARRWLEQHNLPYHFHDYKKAGIDADTLRHWCRVFGYEQLLNRRGTTWKQLPQGERDPLDETRAIALMRQHTSLIKRPLVDTGKDLLLGFDPARWQSLL